MFRVSKVRYWRFTDKPNRFIQTLIARCSLLGFNLFLLLFWRHMGVHKMKIWGSQIYNRHIISYLVPADCSLKTFKSWGKVCAAHNSFDLNLIDWSNMFVHQTSADVCDLFGFVNSAVKIFNLWRGEKTCFNLCIYVVTLSCWTEQFQRSLLPKPTFVSEAPPSESELFRRKVRQRITHNSPVWPQSELFPMDPIDQVNHCLLPAVMYFCGFKPAFMSASCFRGGVLTPMWIWSYRLEDQEQVWFMKCSLIVAAAPQYV